MQLKKEVYSGFYQLKYAKRKAATYQFLDSLYQNFSKSAKRRFELGETNYLEMITAQSKQKQVETVYNQAKQDVIISEETLKKVIQLDTLNLIIDDLPLTRLEVSTLNLDTNPGLNYLESSKAYVEALEAKEKQTLLPDLSAEYFQGSNRHMNGNLKGYQFGIKIPVLFSGQASKIKASKIAVDRIDYEKQNFVQLLKSKQQKLMATLIQYEDAITYYNTQGKQLSEEIIKTANRSFKEGEIDFFQYIQSIETAKTMELDYLENLNHYNQTVINLNFLIL